MNLYRLLSTQGHPKREHADILRAAVVLSLGALDALVADRIVEAVPEASKQGKLGERVADWLAKDGARCLSILAHDRPHKAIADFVADKLSNTTLQKPAAISDNLRAIIKVDAPWSAAAKRIGGGMTEDDLQKRLLDFYDRRNQIAHKGDVPPKGRAAEPIARDWTERHVKYVRLTGEAICDAVAKVYGPKRGRPKKSSTR